MKSENSRYTLCRLHGRAHTLFAGSRLRADEFRCAVRDVGGASVLDCGVDGIGSLQTGLVLARLCLGDHAEVALAPAEPDMITDIAVTVATDHPIAACLGGQYAGWPLSVGSFFAMASGPMRMLRGREVMLQHLGLITPAQSQTRAVGVLESDRLPDAEVVAEIAV